MFCSVARLPSLLYVPETSEPVMGIASCNNVFVVTMSLFRKGLKVVAIIQSFYYEVPDFLRYLTGTSIDVPVVAAVTRIYVST